MQIVIDLPDENYQVTLTKIMLACYGCRIIELPKGHGRILDEKEILNTEKHDGSWYDLVDLPEYIAGVSAIVEADKSERTDA